MSMFDSYDHLSDHYIPSNKPEKPPVCQDKFNPLQPRAPYEEYDAKGNLIGYWWHYGDTINLDFTIDGEITIEDNAIILNGYGETPNENVGEINQQAYNVVDEKSWTCTAIDGDIRIWTQNEEYIHPVEDGRNIYVTAKDYLKDKEAQVILYNFRHETLVTKTFKADTSIIFAIDKELSKQLIRGVYYVNLIISSKNLDDTVFYSNETTLYVK